MESRNLCSRTSFIYVLSAVYVTAICIRLAEAETYIDEECIPVCDSKDCIYIANTILSQMNSEIDPCENFDSFLCGRFKERFALDDLGHMVNEAWNTMFRVLKDIIINTQPEPESATSKMKIVYDSCINYGSSDVKGIQTFKETLNDVGITNWPQLSPDFSLTSNNFAQLIGLIYYYTTDDFFRIIYEPKDENQNDEKVLKADFDINSFEKPIKREEAEDILKYFDLESEEIEIIIKDYEDVQRPVVNFHENITCENCSDVQVDCRHQSNEELVDLCQIVNTFLKDVKSNVLGTKRDIVLSGEDAIFAKGFFNVLKSLSHRSLANYFAMKLLYANYEHLNFYLRRIKLKYAPKEVAANKDAQCLKAITQFINLILQNEFFHRFTENPGVEKILSLYKDYQSKIFNIVVNQDWILPDVKVEVQNMIQGHRFYMEYWKKLLPNDTFVNEYYKMFHPTEDFFANVLQLKKFRKMKPCGLEDDGCLISCIDVYDLETCTAITYLSWSGWLWNGQSIWWSEPFQLAIDLGVLTFPLSYSPGQIKEINYVNLGGIVAHEFGHSIDKFLEHYGESHNLTSSANETLMNFEKRKECIVNSIAELKYDYLNENLDGNYYLTETLGDVVQKTFIEKFVNDSITEEFLLPGLSVSTSQLLYMSANQMFCAKYNKKQELKHIEYDRHPPLPKRLLFMTRNSRKFSEVFHCPLGSYMNPSTKCALLD